MTEKLFTGTLNHNQNKNKTKEADQLRGQPQLIYAFVFAYANNRFSRDEAQIKDINIIRGFIRSYLIRQELVYSLTNDRFLQD